LKNSLVYATDISKDALDLASENAELNKVEQRIKFFSGDLFDPFVNKKLGNSLNCIISNPPYVKDSDFENLDKEIKDFEPESAFLCGDNGINFHKKIAEEGLKYLKVGGLLALEVALGDDRKLVDFISSNLPFNNLRVVKDLAGIRRIVLGAVS
jgi:release factor glutamine methyltransferase